MECWVAVLCDGLNPTPGEIPQNLNNICIPHRVWGNSVTLQIEEIASGTFKGSLGYFIYIDGQLYGTNNSSSTGPSGAAGSTIAQGTGCSGQQYACQDYACAGQNSNYTGGYSTLAACQADCAPCTTYDCLNGTCTLSSQYDTAGSYSSLAACQAACGGPTCSTGQLCATPSTICAGTCCTGGQSCADPSSICSGTCCPAGQSCYDPNSLTTLCQSGNACPTCPTCPTCPEDNVQFSTINAQIFEKCDSSGNPVYTTQAVSVIQGTEDAETLKFKELAEIYAYQNCNSDTDCAAIPLGWQIRPEASRPQAIFQFAEVDGSGNITGSPKYPITVPHLVNNPPTNPLPNYTKGNWELIYVLNDNSRVTIHAMDQDNANTVLNAIIPLLDTNYTSKAYTSKSGLVITQTPIAQNLVTCRMVKYYSTGVQNSVPDWIVKWD